MLMLEVLFKRSEQHWIVSKNCLAYTTSAIPCDGLRRSSQHLNYFHSYTWKKLFDYCKQPCMSHNQWR